MVAATLLDLLQKPQLREEAWTYFRDVQTKDTQYLPFISDDDDPAIEKNAEIMARYKDRLKALYYDPGKYDTYLEQLGIDYPQLENPDAEQ